MLCGWAVEFKNRMKWDDALDVWGVHGVGGVFGTILLGPICHYRNQLRRK